MIFVDNPSYICFPIERLGLSSDTLISSIATSCECVRGRLVSYKGPEDTEKLAIMLEFRNEGGPGIQSALHPVELGVDVTIVVTGGSKHEFTIKLLKTFQEKSL